MIEGDSLDKRNFFGNKILRQVWERVEDGRKITHIRVHPHLLERLTLDSRYYSLLNYNESVPNGVEVTSVYGVPIIEDSSLSETVIEFGEQVLV